MAAHRRAAIWPQANAAPRSTRRKFLQYSAAAGKTAGLAPAGPSAFLDGPLQRGLDRACPGIKVGTIEAQAGFKTQAVAGAKPNRHHQRVPQEFGREALRRVGGHADLEAILTRVTGTRNLAQSVSQPDSTHVHEAHASNGRI